jgi:hypothetical protein
VGSLLVAWPSFADSHRVYADLEPLLDRIEIGSSVLTLNLGPYYGGRRLWNPVVVEGHVIAVRGGRTMDDYTLSPTSPVAQRADRQWSEAVYRMQLHPYAMRPDWDLTRFRYLLVTTGTPGLAAAVSIALQDDARLIAENGSWYLYESKLPVVPIDAPNAPLPPHPGASLIKRLETVSEALRAQSGESDAVAPDEPSTEAPAP